MVALHRGGSPLHCLRPTVLDLRFRGDPWILRLQDGSLSLCLGNFHLGPVHGSPLDLPSLNQLLDRVRHQVTRRSWCPVAKAGSTCQPVSM